MKVKKAIKRIIALGTGLTMLGATVFGAMAADLGAYPNQFIKDGKFDGLMVVGANAKTDDVLGIVDIATSLQYASKKDVSVTGVTTASLSGDAFQVGSSADNLELGEFLGKVKSTITSEELGALATKKIRTSKGSTDADQYLKFNSTAGLTPSYEENKDKVVADYLKSNNGDIMFVYEMQFPEGLKSSTYTSTSSNTKITTGTGYLNDLDNEQIYILGDTFSVIEATIEDSTADVALTLMGGAVFDSLKEQETKTYDINGKKYEVTVVIIADSNDAGNNAKVKLMINGEVTKQLQEGDTDTLDDGTVIGIDDVLANEGAEQGGEDIVGFYIGANKIELTDTNYTDTAYDTSGVKIDEESIEDAAVEIDATWTSDEAKITSIKYMLKADSKVSGDLYIAKGDSLRNMLDEPQGMLSKVWDVKYLGLTEPTTSEIAISPSGDDAYYLDFVNGEGIEYSVPLIDNSNDKSKGYKFGTDDEKLVFVEATACADGDSDYAFAPIYEDDYFVISKVGDQEKAFTHVLTFDSVDVSDGVIQFSDLAGGTKEVTFATTGNECQATSTNLIVGGESYSVVICGLNGVDSDTADSDFRVCVDLDGDGSVEGAQTTITVQGGALLGFMDAWTWSTDMGIANGDILQSTDNKVYMNLSTVAKYTDSNTAQQFNFSVYNTSSNKVDLDYYTNVAINLSRNSDKGSDYKKGMTSYGVYVEEYDDPDSTAADTLTIMYPSEQVFAQAFVTGGDSTAAASKTGRVYAEVQIEVGKSVLDSEITSMTSDNLIVVGGPCVNSVAAKLLDISGSQPACYEDFPVEEGQGIIQIVQNGDKVAVLVAGYSAADTRNAAQVLANSADYATELKGKSEVVVSGKQILAPQVKTEAPAEEPAEDTE